MRAPLQSFHPCHFLFRPSPYRPCAPQLLKKNLQASQKIRGLKIVPVNDPIPDTVSSSGTSSALSTFSAVLWIQRRPGSTGYVCSTPPRWPICGIPYNPSSRPSWILLATACTILLSKKEVILIK